MNEEANQFVNQPAFTLTHKMDALSGLNYYEYLHTSGLNLLWLPKPGFVRKFAAFGIPFGSIHQELQDEKGEVMPVAAGTAHYLEHCIFSRDDEGGLMGKLAALGCQANAFTSYTQTVYFFSGTERFDKAFELYFEALLHPYLEEDRVVAERGIIGAELDMYSDDPDAFAFKTMMSKLYIKHGAKEDIGGSRVSIETITSAHLKQVWSRFYSPAGMRLVIVGDFNFDEQGHLLNSLDRALSAQSWPAAVMHKLQAEPAEVLEPELHLQLAVENASFLMGIKDPYPFAEQKLSASQLAQRNMAVALYLDSVIGDGSTLYSRLYDQGLINDSFTAQYMCEEDFAFMLLSCETDAPEYAAQQLLDLLRAEMTAAEVPEEIFSIQKKAALGHFLRALDGVESLGMTVVQATMSGLEIGEYAGIIDQVTIEEAKEYLSFLHRDDLRVQVYVTDKGENKR